MMLVKPKLLSRSESKMGNRNPMFGKATWNKGLVGICKSNEGSFKKGFIPWNKGTGKLKEEKVYLTKEQRGEICKQNALCRKTSNKGMKYNISVESHKSMSEAKKGKPSWNKGKTGYLTEDQRARMTASQKLKKVPIEVRIKIANSLRGENASNWKGGISPKYHIIRHCMEYRLWRKSVFERDNWTCIWCGSKKELQADHIKRFAEFPELRFAIDNGRTLCRKCHLTTETYGKRK